MKLTPAQREYLRRADGARGGVIGFGPHLLTQRVLHRRGLIERRPDGYWHTNEAGRAALAEKEL